MILVERENSTQDEMAIGQVTYRRPHRLDIQSTTERDLERNVVRRRLGIQTVE